MKRSILLLSIFLLLDCTSSLKKDNTEYGEVRTIEAPFTNLFYAARDFLQENGYPIIKSSFDMGELETDHKPGAGWSDKNKMKVTDPNLSVRSTRGTFRLPDRNTSSGTLEQRARVIAKIVKIDEVVTSLTISILCEVRDLESGWQYITDDTRESRIMYDRIFKGIIKKTNIGN
jgi:hypothetical protein